MRVLSFGFYDIMGELVFKNSKRNFPCVIKTSFRLLPKLSLVWDIIISSPSIYFKRESFRTQVSSDTI